MRFDLNNFAWSCAELNCELPLAEIAVALLQRMGGFSRKALVMDTIAWVRYRQGRVREARELLLDAIRKTQPEWAEIYYPNFHSPRPKLRGVDFQWPIICTSSIAGWPKMVLQQDGELICSEERAWSPLIAGFAHEYCWTMIASPRAMRSLESSSSRSNSALSKRLRTDSGDARSTLRFRSFAALGLCAMPP